MTALKDTVLILPDPLPDTTKAGLFMPTRNQKNRTGTVQCAGPDCDTVKEGMRVIYIDRRAIEQNGLHLVTEGEDVIGIV